MRYTFSREGRFVVKLFRQALECGRPAKYYTARDLEVNRKGVQTIGPVSAPYASVIPLIDCQGMGRKTIFCGNAKHVKVTAEEF